MNGPIKRLDESKLFIPIKELHLKENYKQINSSYKKIPENGRIRMDIGAFQKDKQIGTSEDSYTFTIE